MLENEVLSKEFLLKLLQSMRDAGAGRVPPGANEEYLAPAREFMAFLEAAAAPDAPPLTRGQLDEAKKKLYEGMRALLMQRAREAAE